MRKPYNRLTVTLPAFVIIGLRETVKEANAKDRDGERWTVSKLLEMWFMDAFGKEGVKHWKRIARRSPEFNTAAEEWLRWTVEDAEQRRTRKR